MNNDMPFMCAYCGSMDHLVGQCQLSSQELQGETPWAQFSPSSPPVAPQMPPAPATAVLPSVEIDHIEPSATGPSDPNPYPALGQEVPLLVTQTHSYPAPPQIPNFKDYSLPTLLLEDLFKWGSVIGDWAIGFQSFAVQMSEVVKLQPGNPLFESDGLNFQVTIQIHNTINAQQELTAAYHRGAQLIARMIPGSPGILPDGHASPSAEPDPSGLYVPTPQTFSEVQLGSGTLSKSVNESVPLRGGKKRGRPSEASRDRGDSTRGKVTKPRKNAKADKAAKNASTSSPKAAAVPRKRGPAKKKLSSSEGVKEDKATDATGDETVVLGESLDIASVISQTIGGIDVAQNNGKGKGKEKIAIKTNDEAVLVDRYKENSGTQEKQDLNIKMVDEASFTQQESHINHTESDTRSLGSSTA